MSLHPVKGGLILGVLLAAAITMVPSHTYKVPARNYMHFALELYKHSAETRLSSTSQELFSDTVDRRLQCYQLHGFYLERMQICNCNYVSEIINNSRKRIRSMPAVGSFAREVRRCPVVYAICMGKYDDKAKCRDMELRCIDYNLDLYWRGVNLYRHPLQTAR